MIFSFLESMLTSSFTNFPREYMRISWLSSLFFCNVTLRFHNIPQPRHITPPFSSSNCILELNAVSSHILCIWFDNSHSHLPQLLSSLSSSSYLSIRTSSPLPSSLSLCLVPHCWLWCPFTLFLAAASSIHCLFPPPPSASLLFGPPLSLAFLLQLASPPSHAFDRCCVAGNFDSLIHPPPSLPHPSPHLLLSLWLCYPLMSR